MNKLFLILSLVCQLFLQKLSAQTFYFGINGLGKLTLNDNGVFYLQLKRCTVDTGSYYFKGDTLHLNTNYEPVKVKYFKDTIGLGTVKMDSLTVIVYDEFDGSRALSIKKYPYNPSEAILYINDAHIKDGQWIKVISGFGDLAFRWDGGEFNNAKVELDLFSEHLWLSDFRLLCLDNYLFPFISGDNRRFYIVNRLFFYSFKKGLKNRKFELYRCKVDTVN